MSTYQNKAAKDPVETPLPTKIQRMVFDPSVSLGHLLTVLTLVLSGAIWIVTVRGEVHALQKQVDRHEALITKIDDTQRLAIQAQREIGVRLADHLDATKVNIP